VLSSLKNRKEELKKKRNAPVAKTFATALGQRLEYVKQFRGGACLLAVAIVAAEVWD
jgi:hypothetical protein